MDESGQPTQQDFDVVQNYRIPDFHIKESYTYGGYTYTFKYWKLTSGTLTSSLTALSDLVYAAVYDKTKATSITDVDKVTVITNEVYGDST